MAVDGSRVPCPLSRLTRTRTSNQVKSWHRLQYAYIYYLHCMISISSSDTEYQYLVRAVRCRPTVRLQLQHSASRISTCSAPMSTVTKKKGFHKTKRHLWLAVEKLCLLCCFQFLDLNDQGNTRYEPCTCTRYARVHCLKLEVLEDWPFSHLQNTCILHAACCQFQSSSVSPVHELSRVLEVHPLRCLWTQRCGRLRKPLLPRVLSVPSYVAIQS